MARRGAKFGKAAASVGFFDEPCESIPGQSMALVTVDSDGFKVNDDALARLAAIPAPLAIVSVAGLYRTGKSFLLNRVILKGSNGFEVGPTTRACTKGIWMWTEPIVGVAADGRQVNIIVVDTEGIGAPTADATHDTRIFALGLLLSTFFIYNSQGAIDEEALSKMSMVTNLSKDIRGNVASEDGSAMQHSYPAFLWVLRDFALQMRDDHDREIGSREYMENALKDCEGRSETVLSKNRVRACLREFFPERDCFTLVRPCTNESDLQVLDKLPNKALRAEFLQQADELRSRIVLEACRRPNRINGCELTGSMLGYLCKNYVHAINQGKVPVIQDAWSYMCDAQKQKVEQELVSNFTLGVGALAADTSVKRTFDFNAKLDALIEHVRTTLTRTCASLYPHENVTSMVDPVLARLTPLADVAKRQFKAVRQTSLSNAINSACNALEEQLARHQFTSLDQFHTALAGAYTNFLRAYVHGDEEEEGSEDAAEVEMWQAKAAWHARADTLVWRAVQDLYGPQEQQLRFTKTELERLQGVVSTQSKEHQSTLSQVQQQNQQEINRMKEVHSATLAQLTEELQDATSALQQRKARVDELEAEILSVTDECASKVGSLTTELDAGRDHNESLLREIEGLREDIEAYEEEAEVMAQQARTISELTLDRDRLRNELVDAKRVATESKKNLGELESSFYAQSNEIKAKAFETIKSLKETRKLDQAQLKEAREKCAATETLLSTVHQELELLKQQAQQQVQDHKDRVRSLEAQLQDSEGRLTSASQEYTTRLNDLEQRRKEERGTLQSEFEKSKQEHLKVQQDLTRRIRETEQRATTAESKLTTRERELEVARGESQRKRPRADLEDKSLQLVRVEAEVSWLRQQKEELTGLLGDERRGKSELEERNKALERSMNHDLDRLRFEYENKIAMLEQQLIQK